jgi:nucleoside-diphosphate-sugar epimerase
VPTERLSAHLRSRHEVEQILSASGVPTTTLRAAIIVGSGSTSFEVLRQLSERLPVRALPAWMRSTVQPVAVTDVLEALVGCLEIEPVTRSYDVGGEERLSYRHLLDLYAEVAGLVRAEVTLPVAPTALVGWLAGQLTDVPSSTVEALVGSLHHDMVCREAHFRADLLPEGWELTPLREALERALTAPAVDGPAGQGRPVDLLGPVPGDPDWAGGSIHVEAGRAVRRPRNPAESLLLGLPRPGRSVRGTDREA